LPGRTKGRAGRGNRRETGIAHTQLANRIFIFLNLAPDKLDRLALQKELDAFGKA
jgi:hypothetical protein